MTNIIEVKNLTRKFGAFTAVDNISFAVDQGEIFGFLGPNGAGKSTTISMLCTLLKPTSGTATINGHDVKTDQTGVRRSIGLIFQEPTLDTRLTAWQNIQIHALLYNVPPAIYQPRATELLNMVGLTDKINLSVAGFSGGMKRRLEIVLGLLHSPQVLFLDEPTIGLDPQTRRRIWGYLQELRRTEGLTIFLTTHYMDEAEFCHRIAVIDQGHIIATGSPDELKSQAGTSTVLLNTSNDKKALDIIKSLNLPAKISQAGVNVVTNNGDEFIPTIVQTLASDKYSISVTKANWRRPTMDDVFVNLTGSEIRHQGADLSDSQKMLQIHNGGRL